MSKKKLAILSLFLLSIMFIPHRTSSNSNMQAAAAFEGTNDPQSRTVAFEFYSFFDPGAAAMKPDVWLAREDAYGEDHVLSYTYPVVYEWEPSLGWFYYYSSLRLKVAGTDLPEISIDEPEFVPYNLMGGLEPGVKGGTVNIRNWHLDFIDEARRAELTFPKLWYDGYVSELRGDVVMDKNATMKVLGISQAQYADIANWWTANEADVETAWEDWLYSEDERVDIRPFFDWPFVDFTPRYEDPDLLPYLSLFYNATSDQVTLSLNLLTGGMEALLARWFRETFMPYFEASYDDLKFNATIGPSTTNLDMDTAVHWLLFSWSYNDTAYEEASWAFEPFFGDVPELAEVYNVPTSPAYPYNDKTYYVVTPGNEWYDDFHEYDYTPSSFDLKAGETLTLRWGDVNEKGPVTGYKQEPWDPATQKPIDTVVNLTGGLVLSDSSEPYPWMGEFPENIAYDPVAETLTYIGPFNMTELQLSEMPEEWDRLADPQHPNGILPWGEPYVEFLIRPLDHDIQVEDVRPSSIEVAPGSIVTIDVDVGNRGSVTKTFDVTTYYNDTSIKTETVEDLEGYTSRTIQFAWNTTGVSEGNYTIKANATVPDDPNPWNNEFIYKHVKMVSVIHDVAITTIAAPSEATVGEEVTIEVTVKNEGTETETFSVSAYYDTTIIGTENITDLTAGSTEDLNFTWNTTQTTPGSYTVKVEAETVSGETDTADNTKTAQVKVILRDIAISMTAPSEATVGEEVTIEVTVKNEGTETETFSVSAYNNTDLIETRNVTDIAPGASRYFSLTWNTTGTTPGNYTLKIEAETLPGETDTADNTKTATIKLVSPSQLPVPLEYILTAAAIIVITLVAGIYILRRRS